jgi:hypothetical protein
MRSTRVKLGSINRGVLASAVGDFGRDDGGTVGGPRVRRDAGDHLGEDDEREPSDPEPEVRSGRHGLP